MAKYRLRVGKKHLHEGKLLEVGAVVELTESQARNWHDKFELVSGTTPTEPSSTPVKTSGDRVAELAKPANAAAATNPPPEAKKE